MTSDPNWLDVACNAHAKMAIEKLLGPATIVMKSGETFYLYYRLKAPAKSKEEQRKLTLARELAAKIAASNNVPPAAAR